jgi:hypothetical protein
MQTKIDVSLTPALQVRLAVTLPGNVPGEPDLVRHVPLDLPLLPALLLAARLITGVVEALQTAAKRRETEPKTAEKQGEIESPPHV